LHYPSRDLIAESQHLVAFGTGAEAAWSQLFAGVIALRQSSQ
jgi:hypothetical protein